MSAAARFRWAFLVVLLAASCSSPTEGGTDGTDAATSTAARCEVLATSVSVSQGLLVAFDPPGIEPGPGPHALIFMEPDATPGQIQAIEVALDADQRVESWVWVDQEGALAEAVDLFDEGPWTALFATANLPPSFRVVLRDPEQTSSSFGDAYESADSIRRISVYSEPGGFVGAVREAREGSPSTTVEVTYGELITTPFLSASVGIFVNPGADPEPLAPRIEEMDGIHTLEFVNHELAREEMERMFGEAWASTVAPDQVPESFHITLSDPAVAEDFRVFAEDPTVRDVVVWPWSVKGLHLAVATAAMELPDVRAHTDRLVALSGDDGESPGPVLRDAFEALGPLPEQFFDQTDWRGVVGEQGLLSVAGWTESVDAAALVRAEMRACGVETCLLRSCTQFGQVFGPNG